MTPAEPKASSPSAARAPEVQEQAPQIARARAIAVTKTAPTHRLQEGDLICGNCGEGNAPARKFCSRCGSSLVEAEVITKLPWWRRIRLRIRRGPKTVKLGAEKGRTASGAHINATGFNPRHLASSIYRKARVIIAAGAVAAGVIYGIYPPFRTEVNSLFHAGKAKVGSFLPGKPVSIIPISCTGAAVTAHPAINVCELSTNKFWEARWSPSDLATITMTFQHRVTLTNLLVTSGAFGAYTANGRPNVVRLVFSNQESDTINLQDTSAQQQVSVKHALLVSSVKFQVISVYPGQANPNDVAVSQIQLFGHTTG